MSKPTNEQILAEKAALIAAKSYVPERNYFGQSNHACLDACVEVLNKRLSYDQTYDRGCGEDEEDDSKWEFHVREAALECADWLAGDREEPASKSWEHLKK